MSRAGSSRATAIRFKGGIVTNRALLIAGLAAALAAAAVVSSSSSASAAAQGQAPAPATQGRGAPLPPNPSTQEPAHRTSYDDVIKMETTLSNWNRWGAKDERGTLNLVTAERTKQAARLVKDGVTVSLAHFASLEKAIDNFQFSETKHAMWNPSGQPWNNGRARAALDTISFGTHDGTMSHMDALCHYSLERDGKVVVYNGHPADYSDEGCTANSIDRMGAPFATRAILVDMPLLRHVPYLEPRTPIYPSDLEEWEKFANVKIGSGDAVLIRTGRWALRAEKGPWNSAREAAGLHVSVMPWLKQRDVALLGSDAVNDVQPSGIVGGSGEAASRPVHTLAIAIMGTPLIDNGYFEDAAKEAAARKRWDFFMTVAPNRIEHGTATPFNAVGVF
jgi:putative cyclase